MTIIFISHDLNVCRHLCDEVVVLKDGAVCETGPTLRVFDAPEHAYTRQLLTAAPAFSASHLQEFGAGAGATQMREGKPHNEHS